MPNTTPIRDLLEMLASRAWSKPCYDPSGDYLLRPSAFEMHITPESLRQALGKMYEHARYWAPGLEIPYFVPPVRIADLTAEAGHFVVDEESYASVAVAQEFTVSQDAVLTILAHEACHHILLQSGLDQSKDTALNEITTDLTTFVCGFGDIVQRGRSIIRHSESCYSRVHLGYLKGYEYDFAYQFVLSRRLARGLPGVRPQTNSRGAGWFWKVWQGLFRGSYGGRDGLLEKVLKETERRQRTGN